jgi:hypothetical protein
MHVHFTYTQEDAIDANLRFLRRSKTLRSGLWNQIIFLILFSWLLLYVIFISFLKNPYLAVISGVVAALACVALFPALHEREIKKRLRSFIKEQYGEKNAFLCDVELTPQEVRVVGEDCQRAYEWKLVEEIVVMENSVDIFARTGAVIVRNRAFELASQREEFVSMARRYLAAAQKMKNE